MLTVLKPFPHPTRRFSVGTEINEADLVGCTIPLTDLKKGRFVAGADTKAAETAVERLADPEGTTKVSAIVADRDAGKKSTTA